MKAFDKAWQILKENVGEAHHYNQAIDYEGIRGENQALENVGEMPSVKELMDKLMRGEQLTTPELLMLQRF